MGSKDSVMDWFHELEQGNSAAAEALWNRYFPELVRLAREKLRGVPGRMADEEDIALSVMDSFFGAAQEKRLPDMADRKDLWRLLLWITANKVIDLKRRETRQRRGGGRVHNESDGAALAQAISDTPTPEFAAMMAEECRNLLEKLRDPQLQELAVAKMQGYTNQEIADRLGCKLRSVERQLHLIRKIWEQEQPP